jgi:ABC-type branched-subunit amino acid transport system ATPase component
LAHFAGVMEQGPVVLEGPSAEVTASEHVQTAYFGGR